MQFMNSSPKKLFKNLSDNDFKYLAEEFSSKNLELLKRFREKILPDKECFYSFIKDGTTDDNGKKLDGHISDENFLTCN